MVACDGCVKEFHQKDLGVYMPNGVQARYCGACGEIWSAFEKAHEAMSARFNRLLDEWAREKRETLPLKFTPLDLPALAASPSGALRLG